MNGTEHDPYIIDMRCEIVVAALEGAFSQAKGLIRFLELDDLDRAAKCWDRLRIFVNEVEPEMVAIRGAAVSKQAFGEAAVEYRKRRDAGRKPEAPIKRSA